MALEDASTTKKGIVQLSSATNSTSESLAATPKAVKAAYDNAEKRLQKDQNGADIPDKGRFLSNINVYSKGEVDKKKGMRKYTFSAPANAVSGKWYPVVFRRTAGGTDELASRVVITTYSSAGGYAMNNCEFNGFVMPGGWSDRGSYAAGFFSIYSTAERAIHSIISSVKDDDLCSVFYVEARAFPIKIFAEEGLNVIVPTTDYTVGQATYKWGATDPVAESTNTQTILDFKNGRGYYCSHPFISSLSGNAATATKLQTARSIGGVGFDGSANINLPGVNTTGNQNTTGNAATATKLQTARTIGGVSFDGTANINLPGVNTTGNQNTTGNAATATKLQAARTINGVSFDGSKNIELTPRSIGTINSATMSFSGGAGWFKLATVTMQQASSVVYISLIGGAGYNVGSPHQAGISELVLRAGNGNPKGITGALWRRTSVGFTNFAWVNTSGDTYDIYVEIGNFATGVNIQWDYTSNASVTIHTSPNYTVDKPTGLTDGTVYVIYSSHIKPTATDVGALPITGGNLNGGLTATGEIVSRYANGFRIAYGSYGFFIRNDSSNTYFMLTDSGNSLGTYNSLRPLIINNANGTVTIGNGLNVTGGINGSLNGNASTATKLQKARNINGVQFDGSADISIPTITSRGRVTALTGTTQGDAAGLQMYEAYNNGYPTAYGNILHLKGATSRGEGELLIGWSGTSGAHAPVFIRSKRDYTEAAWSEWAQVYTSKDSIPGVNTTGNQNTTGNAATATKLQTARTINGVSFDGSANISLSPANIGCPASPTGWLTTGNNGESITTAQLVTLLQDNGAFNTKAWIARCAWAYANSASIPDSETGCGIIPLAGAVIEVFNNGSSSNNYTIRITTATTTSVSGALTNAEFVYVFNGTSYSPGWRRAYNTKNKPTAADVGALPLSGGALTGGLTAAGEIISKSANGLRIAYGNYGFFIRNDGSSTYFMLTASGDNLGTWNSLRPLIINNANGAVSIGNGLNVTGDIRTNAWVYANRFSVNSSSGSWISMRDQNVIFGLNKVSTSSAQALLRQDHADRKFFIGGLGNSQFGFYMINNSRTANGTDGQAFLDSSGNFQCGGQILPANYSNFDSRYTLKTACVTSVRMGSAASYRPSNNGVSWTQNLGSGLVMTGIIVQETGSHSADNIGGIYYRPVQYCINGTWYTAASV
ncbi:TPA: tail fiber protein [Escherichia coli]|nr:tail fiber protein [Escherichia coli]